MASTEVQGGQELHPSAGNLDPSHRDAELPLDFTRASAEVLALLQERVGMAAWFITRSVGDDSLVLAAADRFYDVVPGDLLQGADSRCQQVVGSGGCRMSGDAAALSAEGPPSSRLPVGSYVGVPLTGPEGAHFGALCAVDPAPNPSLDGRVLDDVEFHGRMLSALLAAELRADDERRRAERAELASMVDVLSGASNRRGWERLLDAEESRCRRYGTPAAVIVLDLDDMKRVNETYGHTAGDELLRLTAQVIRDSLRDHDGVARLGGDEFGVLVVDCDQELADRLGDRLGAALADNGVAASVGTSARAVERGTLADAWAAADAAMHQNKRSRRLLRATLSRPGRRVVRNQAEEEAARLSAVTPDALLGALAGGQFRLHLQPVIDLVSGRVSGAEALIRWHHPERGMLGPGEFLAVAETAGAIRPIGEWVIAESCRIAKEWDGRGHPLNLTISANVSVRQLDDPVFADRVLTALGDAGLPASRLRIEITETLPLGAADDGVDDAVAMSENLSNLRAAGVLVALDDFGTRYATLETLLRCPVDILKIDRVFVERLDHDPLARELVRSVVDVATSSGLLVVGEGVESMGQASTLVSLGCHEAQGYYFGRPLPAGQFDPTIPLHL